GAGPDDCGRAAAEPAGYRGQGHGPGGGTARGRDQASPVAAGHSTLSELTPARGRRPPARRRVRPACGHAQQEQESVTYPCTLGSQSTILDGPGQVASTDA